MTDTYYPDNSTSKFVYNPGDETKFYSFLENVKSPEVKDCSKLVRDLLSANNPLMYSVVKTNLDCLIKGISDEKIKIQKDDLIAWEMIGRSYKFLCEYYCKANDFSKTAECGTKALVSFSKAKNNLKIIETYELISEKCSEVKKKYESYVNKILRLEQKRNSRQIEQENIGNISDSVKESSKEKDTSYLRKKAILSTREIRRQLGLD